MTIRRLAALLIMCCIAASARAGDGMQSITALWNDFSTALRRGDYQLAHSMFSPESRAAMPYQVFVLEYGPASVARELILSPPESLTTKTDGDWGEISFSGLNSGSGRPFRVGVALVRNQGAWGLVAARNEGVERLEASARFVLSLATKWRGDPEASAKLSSWLGGIEDFPTLQYYRFETDGRIFRAVPLSNGLRAFHVDEWDMIKPGLTSPPPAVLLPDPLADPAPTARRPAAPLPELGEPVEPLPPLPPPPPRLVNGLPELAEPPGASAAFPELDVFQEPDVPPPSPPARPRQPDEWAPSPFQLPDVIR